MEPIFPRKAMDHAFTLHEQGLSASTERRSLILLRWMLFLATTALILASRLYQAPSFSANFLILAFAGSNLILYYFWDTLTEREGADILLAALDTLFISASIFLAGIVPSEMFVLSFLVVFLVAFGRTLPQLVSSAVAVGFLYVWMTAQMRPEGMILHPAFLIRIPFLYSVALYFGYIAHRAGSESRRTDDILHERTELRALMDVIETVNSSLDLHHVMLSISRKMAEAANLERCSVLLVEKEGDRSIVLASSDVPEVDRLAIDLSKYPEVQRAIELREPVVIEDVQRHPLMSGVRHFISEAGFNSILVVPMIHRDDLVGTLLLRGASTESQFSPRVVAFCQAVAGASANALKNALLYRQMREESSRHRATAEKLQNILQHSMDLIVTTDLEGRITDFNRTAEQTLGFRREEILGLPLTEIYRGFGDRANFLSILRGAGQIDDRGATMTARDGSRRTFDLTVAVVRNELGEVVGSVCVGKKPYADN